MWEYLAALAGVALVIGLVWLTWPYSSFKRNLERLAKEPITIDSGERVIGLEEYEKSGKGERPMLSLVVPSYNEEDRIPVMLEETA